MPVSAGWGGCDYSLSSFSVTQEAETGFACLQGMRSDVQMLKACVEMLQSLLDLHTSSTDDTLRSV